MAKSMSSKNSVELNDLFDYDMKIYQNSEYFKFSIDSVLLAEFVNIKRGHKRILDMCTGNAPVPLILSKKYNNIDIIGIEIQKEIYDLAKKSIIYNNSMNITLINEDVNNIVDLFKNNKFDIITCNPPYFITYSDKLINDNKIKAIARHEIKIDLESIIKVASKIIKNQGYFYLVHRSERIADIINLFKKYNFGLKRIVPVYNDNNCNSCFVLIEAIYNGKDYVIINKPIFINDYESYQGIFGGAL